MTTPARFRAETKYSKSTQKKANVNLPIMARIGDGGGTAGVVGRPNWYHIRLVDDDNRLTQCRSPVPLGDDDWIYVIKAKDRNLSYYIFYEFIEDSAGGTVPPVPLHDLLGAAHDDTTAAAPTRGDVITAQGAAPNTLWTRLPAATAGAVLIGDGTDVISDITPTFVGVVTVNAGITMGGASGANEITIPGNQAIAMEILDTNAVEYLRIDTAPQLVIDFNQGQADVDFRVAASGAANALFIEGSSGDIGIGLVPGVRLDCVGTHVGGVGLARFTGDAAFGFVTLDTTTGGAADEGGFLINLGGVIHGQFGARGDDTVYVKNRVYGAGDVMTFDSTGFVGIGQVTPATLLELEEVETLAGNIADGYAAALTLDPGYTGAFTATRHNYVDCQNVSVAGGAAVTDAAILRLDAALGAHLATTNLDKTANAKPGTLKVNVNGTILHLQLYAT